jgi:ABC-type sulfate transport system permease subunit
VRANPWLAVGVTLAGLLMLAWLGWAIHITSDHGARQGLGVLVAWPAIVAVLVLISIPFIWAVRVIRASRASSDDVGAEGDQAKQTEDSDGSDSAAAEATETS